MRASKRSKSQISEIHISGAEGIYQDSEVTAVLKAYTKRALLHPRGRPEKIVLTIEKITQKPKVIPSLPVTTLKCSSPSEAKRLIRKILNKLDISETAVNTAFNILSGSITMSGASIVLAESGKRVEPDIERGIRVSRLGINRSTGRTLSLKLEKYGINNITVREAVILASKVASYKQVEAELCISDDPYYLTGYISSKQFGYVRIPNIKRKRDKKGGRVFFMEETTNINSAVKFLEKTPVIIGKVSECSGIFSLDEFFNRYNK